MVEYLIILISLVIGIIIGWVLKGNSPPADNTDMRSKITQLTDEKARAEARLEQLDEIKKGMECWRQIKEFRKRSAPEGVQINKERVLPILYEFEEHMCL